MEQRRLAEPDILRLWFIGGTNNVVRWFELLSSALFTFEITRSGLAVAAVTAARTLPMLLFGAFSGVLSESIDRRRILIFGQAITMLASLMILILALAGLARPWHLAVSSFVCGTIWSTEMSTRRRMVGDLAAPHLLGRAIAVDSLTGAMTRMLGPLFGAAAYDQLGLAGSYGITVALTLCNIALVVPLRHQQARRPLSLPSAARDLLDGLRSAAGQPRVLGVLGVTLVMNMFVFSYSAIVAPVARVVFEAPTAMVGFLAAAESFGAFLAGIALARRTPNIPPRLFMIGGSILFAATLVAMPFMPGFWTACALLALGGTGTAAFSNMQTLLVLNGTPPAVRSRMLGLITASIGTGPLGQLIAGALSDQFGLSAAVIALSASGIVLLLLAGLLWRRAER